MKKDNLNIMKWIIPILFIILPWFFSIIFVLVGFNLMFYFSIIFKRILINPYMYYYAMIDGKINIPIKTNIIPIIHWIFIFIGYGVVTKKKDLRNSLKYFIIISIISILFVHLIFYLLGYSFSLEVL